MNEWQLGEKALQSNLDSDLDYLTCCRALEIFLNYLMTLNLVSSSLKMGIIKYLLEGLSKSIHVNHLASPWQIVSNQYMVAIVIISQALIFSRSAQ